MQCVSRKSTRYFAAVSEAFSGVVMVLRLRLADLWYSCEGLYCDVSHKDLAFSSTSFSNTLQGCIKPSTGCVRQVQMPSLLFHDLEQWLEKQPSLIRATRWTLRFSSSSTHRLECFL